MATEKRCLRCGSTSLEPGVLQSAGRIYFRAENTKVMTFQTGDIQVRSNICLDCGFIELIGDAYKAQSLTGRTKPA